MEIGAPLPLLQAKRKCEVTDWIERTRDFAIVLVDVQNLWIVGQRPIIFMLVVEPIRCFRQAGRLPGDPLIVDRPARISAMRPPRRLCRVSMTHRVNQHRRCNEFTGRFSDHSIIVPNVAVAKFHSFVRQADDAFDDRRIGRRNVGRHDIKSLRQSTFERPTIDDHAISLLLVFWQERCFGAAINANCLAVEGRLCEGHIKVLATTFAVGAPMRPKKIWRHRRSDDSPRDDRTLRNPSPDEQR